METGGGKFIILEDSDHSTLTDYCLPPTEMEGLPCLNGVWAMKYSGFLPALFPEVELAHRHF